MKNMGKIIAVVGAPASGKSTLVKGLEKSFDVVVFHEGEESDLPERIKNNIANEENAEETIQFFHDQSIQQYKEALKLRDMGKLVLLDTFWLSNLFYLDAMVSNEHSRLSFINKIKDAEAELGMPDTILFLKISEDLLEERLKVRGRDFEKDFLQTALKVNEAHEKYFDSSSNNVLHIHAQGFQIDSIADQLKLIRKV